MEDNKTYKFQIIFGVINGFGKNQFSFNDIKKTIKKKYSMDISMSTISAYCEGLYKYGYISNMCMSVLEYNKKISLLEHIPSTLRPYMFKEYDKKDIAEIKKKLILEHRRKVSKFFKDDIIYNIHLKNIEDILHKTQLNEYDHKKIKESHDYFKNKFDTQYEIKI